MGPVLVTEADALSLSQFPQPQPDTRPTCLGWISNCLAQALPPTVAPAVISTLAVLCGVGIAQGCCGSHASPLGLTRLVLGGVLLLLGGTLIDAAGKHAVAIRRWSPVLHLLQHTCTLSWA
eukprot:RCo028557